MTRLADGETRRLAEFTVPSEPGNERLVLTRVADAIADHGLSERNLDRLKTAVAETAMNAIEHGNRNRSELPVRVEVDVDGQAIVVAVTDHGGDRAGGAGAGGEPVEPDIDLKLAGEQSTRGWGLFLIRHMVDAVDETTHGAWHTVRLVMRLGTAGEQGDGEGDGR